ncbi:phage tail sheath C-terminal domain-containing protein [Robbsia sp. KACC 23696]|uniref:phage tail sheath family protein n=1 Tax=Robbsia sp. KACC 23696 TaxID=3149231 RepID=UPI00325A69CA
MSYQNKAPGVYVEETKSLSLSVTSGDTAVPVFAATTADYGTLKSAADYVELDSWLAVTTRVAENSRTTTLYLALAAYFTNGGGRCYVCPVGKLDAVVPTLSDVTLLVQAGVTSTAAPGKEHLSSTTVTTLCGRAFGIFGLLDTPSGASALGADAKIDPALTIFGESALKNENVAFYFPWFKAGASAVPPSAVMAGIYAQVDAERGVWKAPANVAVQGLTLATNVSDADQGKLNSHSSPVNVVRQFGSDAPMVWGARTADLDSLFKYIPVRRLFNALERDIKKAMKLVVFEPNTSATWEKVRSAIDHYLYEIWRQGGLSGTKPEEAYRILIGRDVTMRAEDIENGKLIAEVAVAPSRPAEFIILRFSEKMEKA